MLKQNTKIL